MIAILAAVVAMISQAAPAVPAAPAPPSTSSAHRDVDAANQPRLATAAQLLRDRQPQQALDVATVAVAAYEADLATEKRRLYCGMSGTETLLYLTMAAKDKVEAIATAPGYCDALYLKGFALIDLGRPVEAKAIYARLAELAPMHAPFLIELGQLSRLNREWPRMLATCKRASGLAALADAAVRTGQQTAALRCQGYALVEERKLDQAEACYRDALKLDPGDERSQGELRFIAAQRAKR